MLCRSIAVPVHNCAVFILCHSMGKFLNITILPGSVHWSHRNCGCRQKFFTISYISRNGKNWRKNLSGLCSWWSCSCDSRTMDSTCNYQVKFNEDISEETNRAWQFDHHIWRLLLRPPAMRSILLRPAHWPSNHTIDFTNGIGCCYMYHNEWNPVILWFLQMTWCAVSI